MTRPAEAKRVIFIPWPRVDGAQFETAKRLYREDSNNTAAEKQVQVGHGLTQFANDSEQWRADRPAKISHVKYYDGTPDGIIAGLSAFDVIYVQGHGLGGHPRLLPTSNGEADKGLRYGDVCERLIQSGLQQSWNGDLKFNVCESADRGSSGQRPFAALCSEYLHTREYRCKVWGYSGSVDRRPFDTHRTAQVGDRTYRAKEKRFGFINGRLIEESGGCTLV